MNTCHDCQAKLLNHLYGLLDDADERGVQDHLKVCEPCRAALATAQQQRQLIAFAAKGEFPKVRFAPPAQPVAEPTEAAAVPLPQRSWQRWAIAAGVALAVVGLGLAGGVSCYTRSQDADRAAMERLTVPRAREDPA